MKKERDFTRRLIITYSSVMLVLVVIIFSVVFLLFYDSAVQKEINAQQEFILKTQQQIDTSLKSMDHIINGLLYNKAFNRIMYAGMGQASSIQDSNEVLGIMISLDAPLFLSHRIIAFSPEWISHYFNITKTGDDHTYIQNAIRGYPHYGRLIEANGDMVILPPHRDTFDASGEPVYSVARSVTDGINNYGFIEVQNRFDQLEALCEVDSALGGIVLLSQSGEVVYPLNGELSEANALDSEGDFYTKLYDEVISRRGKSGYFQQDNRQISYIVSDYSQWITLMYSPLSALMPDFAFVSVFLMSLIAVLAAVLTLINILTRRMAAPLSELNKQISHISFENLSMTMPHYNIVEIENINRSFQVMLNHLKREIAHNAQARANEERANYIALQSQMNPHTIYNTISMIESVCYINGDLEASRLCIAFSRMLRYISDNTKSAYTVEDEIQHLNNYAELMKKRYENRLIIDIRCEPGLLAKIIPKFTIQPLVENAIKHGMNRNSQPFIVLVAVETTAYGWRIAVSDNGIGFSKEKIQDINEKFALCDESLIDHKSDILSTKIDNMALNNIYIRWKILMGGRFAIKVGNGAALGGVVELYVNGEGE